MIVDDHKNMNNYENVDKGKSIKYNTPECICPMHMAPIVHYIKLMHLLYYASNDGCSIMCTTRTRVYEHSA